MYNTRENRHLTVWKRLRESHLLGIYPHLLSEKTLKPPETESTRAQILRIAKMLREHALFRTGYHMMVTPQRFPYSIAVARSREMALTPQRGKIIRSAIQEIIKREGLTVRLEPTIMSHVPTEIKNRVKYRRIGRPGVIAIQERYPLIPFTEFRFKAHE